MKAANLCTAGCFLLLIGDADQKQAARRKGKGGNLLTESNDALKLQTENCRDLYKYECEHSPSLPQYETAKCYIFWHTGIFPCNMEIESLIDEDVNCCMPAHLGKKQLE